MVNTTQRVQWMDLPSVVDSHTYTPGWHDMALTELLFGHGLSWEGLSVCPPVPLSPCSVAGAGRCSLRWAAPCNPSQWCRCSLITPKKRRYSMWREGMGPSWAWQMVELFTANSYPVKLDFFSGFFWLRIVQKQIVVLLSARYINLLLQACVNRGTLVHFASRLLVQHYFSSKIKWLNHLQIKSNKQVIINVLGFTRALGLCAYTDFFLEK